MAKRAQLPDAKPIPLNLDFFPQASCHITGRLEAGLGMSYRLRLEKDVWQFHQQQAQWGFMSFATVKAFKGVRWRLETDITSIPQAGVPTERGPARDWRWTWLTGVQTTFNISERFTGNVQMLYNFDRKITEGFPEFLVGSINSVNQAYNSLPPHSTSN